MNMSEDVPRNYPSMATAPGTVDDRTNVRTYVRIQRSKKERRANRLAGIAERKRLRMEAASK